MSENTMTRRSFVKASALVGAAAAVGASMAGSMTVAAFADEAASDAKYDKVIKTTCHGCIQVCPALAYVKDGVVVKIEGDPDAPESRGALCLKGLNQLNTMYSPRRVLHPLKRAGERGENKWEQISWDEAIELASSKIVDAINEYGNYAIFASVGGGGAYSFGEAMNFPTALGSPTVFEPGCAQCYLPRVATAGYMYGGADQSVADNAVQEIFRVDDNKAEVVVLWGAQPSVSQTSQSGRAMAELRSMGVKTVVIDPNYSPDAVHATVWLPLRPASDTALLLCWFRYIFENNLYDAEFTKYWTNVPFLIDPDTKLPALAKDLFPDFKQTTPDNTPAYVCFDEKTGEVAPLEFGMPEDVAVDPAVIWEGEFNGKTYKTAGQIYWDEAEPWTLEATAEHCWLEADKIEEAIKLYAEAGVSGICNGVATDMMEIASQVPLGCMGLDMIMGYINKPGCTMTQKGARGVYTSRPTKAYGKPQWGVGYTVGKTEEENQAIAEEGMKNFPREHELYTQILLDRLGMKDHKGLYDWSHSHIPTVREAIATGEPFKPRVWYDMSGNKLAVLGNATSWYDVFPEVDFVIGQYPMMTSFHIEAADMMLPLREWLEETMGGVGMGGRPQLNYNFCMTEAVHIGETVSHGVGATQILYACREKLGGELPLEGVFPESPSDAEYKEATAKSYGAADWEDFINNQSKYLPQITPPEQYWIYDNHKQIVDDGLPAGFATESRKCEVYCTLLLKMARTGLPHVWPEPQAACDDYSPICKFIEHVESPLNDTEYPYVLTSGRLPHFHHGTMRHAAFSREFMPTAEVRMHPDIAAQIGVGHMDWVKITSRRASTFARAYVSKAMNPKGTVWMERFWNPECYDASQETITGGWREENVNVLTKNTAPFNEVFGSYTNRGFTVKIEPAERPERVWVEAEEFEPFMASEAMKSEPQTGDVF